MAIRVTQGLVVDRTLNNLNAQFRRVLGLQDQLSSGHRVNRPSDDPLDARRAINLRTLITQNEQYLDNITDASPQLVETAATLRRSVDALQRARQLAISGANETLNQDQRNSIALEVDQLLENIADASNHQTNGKFIYGGTRTLSAPFEIVRTGDEITSVTYAGNTERSQVEIANGVRVSVNITGAQAFQGGTDVFQTLIDLRDDLRAGDTAAIGGSLDTIDAAVEQILQSEARVGSVQNRLDSVTANTEDFIIQLQKSLSDKIDADLADTIVNLNAEQNALNAALNAAARVLQPSLLDFLR